MFLTKQRVSRRRQRREGGRPRPCIGGSGPPRPRGVWRRARATEKAPWGAGETVCAPRDCGCQLLRRNFAQRPTPMMRTPIKANWIHTLMMLPPIW